MSNENEIIDVEAVEVHEMPNLPVRQVSTNPRMDYPRWSEEWWTLASPEVQSRRCVAHKGNGDRCLKAAIKGATVCRTHGGATRHVRNAARVRLENAADLMAKKLLGIAISGGSESVRLNAIRDALDRAGLKPPSEVVLSQGEQTPFEAVFESIGGDPEAAGFPSAPMDDAISAGVSPCPAPAYPGYGDDEQAEAGGDDTAEADEYRAQSAPTGPPRQGSPRSRDRDTQPQPGARRISGEAAMQEANWANRAMADKYGLPWGESDRRHR